MHSWIDEKSNMRAAVESTFEQITFSIVQEMREVNETHYPLMVESYISCSFETDQRIAFCISIQDSFLESIVSSLFPDEENISQYKRDAIDELTNTIVGNFFRLLDEKIGDFKLSIPYHERPESWMSSVIFSFLLDDIHPLTVTISE